MTDDEIRIAIAESMGWAKLEVYQQPPEVHMDHEMFTPAPFLRGVSPGPSGIWREPPRYTEDLNAMAEVENTLNGDPMDGGSPQYAYAGWLYGVVTNKSNIQPFRATARQRAEAYLRTIGKWKE